MAFRSKTEVPAAEMLRADLSESAKDTDSRRKSLWFG